MPFLSPLALWAAVGLASAAEVSTPERGHASNPVWSRDGAWLAFEMNDFNGGIKLFAVKVAGGNPVGAPTKLVVPGASSSFSSGKSVATGPVWHPEGILVFEGSASGSDARLFFWSPGGQSPAELLNTTQVAGDLSWPAISADGKRVLFVSDATGLGDVYQWDRSSNQIQNVVASNMTESSPRFDAAARFAFSRKNQGGEDLFTFAGGTVTPHVGGNGDQTRPVWSGEALVFFSSEAGDGQWSIAVSDAVGKRRVVAKEVRLPYRATPALTPDGRWVVYGTANNEEGGTLFATLLDGSRTVKIPTGHVAAGEPSVVNVGGRLMLAYTALPSEGADWRQLHVIDVTDKLN